MPQTSAQWTTYIYIYIYLHVYMCIRYNMTDIPAHDLFEIEEWYIFVFKTYVSGGNV